MMKWHGWESTLMISMVSSQKEDLRILMQFNVPKYFIKALTCLNKGGKKKVRFNGGIAHKEQALWWWCPCAHPPAGAPLEQAEKCNRGVGAETPLAVALPPPLRRHAAPPRLSMSVSLWRAATSPTTYYRKEKKRDLPLPPSFSIHYKWSDQSFIDHKLFLN